MLAMTVTRKRALRILAVVLAVFVGVGMGIMLILSALTASASAGKLPIYCVSRGDNKIAVTFDCAWGNSNTDELLEILKNAGATATFFVTGEFCDKYPEDVKKMFDAGHEIANHSDAHPHVEGININTLIEDTRECSRKIEMITGKAPTLYRAPYGEYDDNVITTIEGMKLKVIQWSVDSIDWQEPDAATIQSRILDGTESGSILLFHNDLANTTQALPEILSKLSEKGFSFVGTSELIYWSNYHIDSTGEQIYDINVTAPAVAYSDNYLINEAFEIMRQNLTLDEIYTLSQGANVAIINKITPLLTEAQIAAIQEMSYEEIKEAFAILVTQAETVGAGGNPDISAEIPSETTYDPSAGEETTSAETTVPEETK